MNRDVLVAALLGAVIALLLGIALHGRGARRTYRRAGPLFTPAEQKFLLVLEKAVAGRARVYAKVRIADVLAVRDTLSGKRFWKAFGAIACKHVDYLLCDPASFTPICAIELDDASHRRADRQSRDALLDDAFAGAGLPLLRVPVRARYVIRDIEEQLRDLLPART